MTRYDEEKRESICWFSKASDLRGAAAVLWASMNSDSRKIAIELGLGKGFDMSVALPRVYRMVCGMSVELLLKAIIVAREGKQPKPIHILRDLAADAGVAYTPEQCDLLDVLSHAIIWDGKYPVPKDEESCRELVRLERERLFDKQPVGDSGLKILSWNGALDWDGYSELWTIANSAMCEVVDWLEKQDV
ncbi:MAG: hypothetical protein WCJ35_24940 [Planctomycetota bacterium]